MEQHMDDSIHEGRWAGVECDGQAILAAGLPGKYAHRLSLGK